VTLADLRRALALMSSGASLTFTRDELFAIVNDETPSPRAVDAVPSPAVTPSASWPERLWTVPAETRMSTEDVAEAVRRTKSWVYRHTSPASGLPQLPHRKLDGELLFVAGEVRTWIHEHEEIIV
jgi:hypothetical protein